MAIPSEARGLARLIEINQSWAARCEKLQQDPTAMLHIGMWFKSSNPVFEGRTPRQLLESGEFEPLLQLLDQLEDK